LKIAIFSELSREKWLIAGQYGESGDQFQPFHGGTIGYNGIILA